MKKQNINSAYLHNQRVVNNALKDRLEEKIIKQNITRKIKGTTETRYATWREVLGDVKKTKDFKELKLLIPENSRNWWTDEKLALDLLSGDKKSSTLTALKENIAQGFNLDDAYFFARFQGLADKFNFVEERLNELKQGKITKQGFLDIIEAWQKSDSAYYYAGYETEQKFSGEENQQTLYDFINLIKES